MNDNSEIVIIRRVDPEDEPHKGGVWKIAHADFMTAMMAFFLIMWLINQSDPQTKDAIANYFNPVNLSQSAIERKGLDEIKALDNNAPDADPDAKDAEKGEAGGVAYHTRKPRFQEGALFQDPYAILARIATDADPTPHDPLGADLLTGESDVPGMPGGETSRDPFDPLYWQVSRMKEMRSDGEVKPGSIPQANGAEPDVRADQAKATGGPDKGNDGTQPKFDPKSDAKADPRTGETDVAKDAGPKPVAAAAPAAAAQEQAPPSEAEQLKREVDAAMKAVAPGGAAPGVSVKKVAGGTLVSLTDNLGFSMFAIGSAEPHPRVVKAMAAIGKLLAARKGAVVIRGHTDARPFRSADYDNWRLSQARAQMALYMLVRGGLPESRIVRVEGHADRDLADPKSPNADVNRRIEILVQE